MDELIEQMAERLSLEHQKEVEEEESKEECTLCKEQKILSGDYCTECREYLEDEYDLKNRPKGCSCRIEDLYWYGEPCDFCKCYEP
jgi:hypothetical protein